MKKIGYILLVFILSFMAAACNHGSDQSQPVAVQGMLDLAEYNIASGQPVPMSGEWEFYWDKLLTPDDFKSGAPAGMRFEKVPGVWNRYRVKNKTLPGFGYATYRIRIRSGYTGDLALSRITPNSAYRIWINGKPAPGAGRVATTPESSYAQQVSEVTPFRARPPENEIILQVSNFSYCYGGLWDRFFIGERSAVEKRMRHTVAFDMFICGGLLLIGCYHLVLFSRRRRDRGALYFGLFALLVAVRVLLTNEMYLLQILPGIPFELLVKANFLTFTLGVPCFLVFLMSHYRDFFIRGVAFFIGWVSAVYTCAVLVLPAAVYSLVIIYFDIFVIFACAYCAMIIVRAMLKRVSGAATDLAGFAVLFGAVIHDVLVAMGVFNSAQIVPLGLFIFMFAQSAGMSVRFSNAFSRAEDMTVRLEEMVKDRTTELRAERDLLRDRNEIIENDMQLARKIQLQLIPQSSPYPFIHASYIPMESVGGDLYDFIEFPESSRVGIFVSDVSGHGVSAAFITSMVKTMILQSGPVRDDPAALLTYLNQMLHGKTAENFVTAFYGIYDPAARSLLYSNAGHNPPYLLGDMGTASIDDGKSLALAIIDNAQLRTRGREYLNASRTFEKGDRLIFYTDGLIEERGRGEGYESFEDLMIGEMFPSMRQTTCRKIVETLYSRLVEWSGSDRFEDDVCVICLEVN